MNSSRHHRAFTIIEVLAVMVVITILSGMLISAAGYARRKARETRDSLAR